MTRSKPRKHSEVAGALVARAATVTDSIADAGHSSDALAVVLAVVQAQTQQIASLVDLVHLLVSRVPGAPMQMPHAVPHAAHSAPRAASAAKAAQPARPAAAAAPVALAAGAPAAERPAAAGAARAASARGPSRRGGLPARVGETSLCRSHVLSIPVAAATRLIAGRGSEGQMARDGIVRGALRDASYLGSTRHVRRLFSDCYGSEETAVAAAAVRVAAAAVDGVSLPVCLAMNLVRFVHDVSGRDRPAGGGVVSASFLNAKPAVGGIGVEPRRGGVLRVLFTVASDAVADTVVRSRRNLRDVDPSAAVFDVLSDREEAQHRALWPAFLAAKAAGKRRSSTARASSLTASGFNTNSSPWPIDEMYTMVTNLLFLLDVARGIIKLWKSYKTFGGKGPPSKRFLCEAFLFVCCICVIVMQLSIVPIVIGASYVPSLYFKTSRQRALKTLSEFTRQGANERAKTTLVLLRTAAAAQQQWSTCSA
ncbi:hypothetical protein FOA52_001805 [Chlamydomonas sp. UWO 241]|nr:hypothetical protein FOA52_001805 [Chlamydomonas sp. UWO 241]